MRCWPTRDPDLDLLRPRLRRATALVGRAATRRRISNLRCARDPIQPAVGWLRGLLGDDGTSQRAILLCALWNSLRARRRIHHDRPFVLRLAAPKQYFLRADIGSRDHRESMAGAIGEVVQPRDAHGSLARRSRQRHGDDPLRAATFPRAVVTAIVVGTTYTQNAF